MVRAWRRVRLVVVGLCLLAVPPRSVAAQEVVEYYALDALGSVRVVFDASGNVIGRMDYDPFGSPLAPGVNLSARAYAGLFRDGEAGLDFAQARSYQARTGRFSTVDPVYAGLFEPQAWNRYVYARNAPVLYTDANGLLAEAIRVTSTPGCESFPAMCEMERRRQAEENASWPSGAGFDIPNATWSPQPRGRGVNLGGTPPPPPPPPIFQPQPPPPAPAPSPPPVADECRVVANSIAGLGLISHFDPLGNTMTAVMLFSVKEPDPWNGRPHGAFRTSLTDPRQGDDVYRHLYFMSSSVMGSPAHAGAGLSLLGSDLRQLVFNTLGIGEPHESAIAEVRDDIAGMAAGVIAKVGAFSPSASARLITKVICK